MIEVVFRDFLLNPNSALVPIVGTRVFQDRLPQSATYPAVVIRKMQRTGTHDMAFLPGHAETRYRVHAAAESFAGLVALREAIFGLDGFALAYANAQGWDTSFNTAQTAIQSAMVVYEQDQFEEGSQLFQHVSDWTLMHTETFTPGVTA